MLQNIDSAVIHLSIGSVLRCLSGGHCWLPGMALNPLANARAPNCFNQPKVGWVGTLLNAPTGVRFLQVPVLDTVPVGHKELYYAGGLTLFCIRCARRWIKLCIEDAAIEYAVIRSSIGRVTEFPLL